MKDILVFGDSISYGEKDAEKGGWVNRLKIELMDSDEVDIVHNLGISGNTSRDILNRFEEELDTRKEEGVDQIVIFQLGTNDSMVEVDTGQNKVSIEEFRQNLENLLPKAREKADHFFFFGLLPIVENKVNPLPEDRTKALRFKDIREYEDELYEFCQAFQVDFLDLFDEFSDRDYNRVLEDGVHPNAEGHELIKEKVVEKLERERLV